jgi:hypothetical protein
MKTSETGFFLGYRFINSIGYGEVLHIPEGPLAG